MPAWKRHLRSTLYVGLLLFGPAAVLAQSEPSPIPADSTPSPAAEGGPDRFDWVDTTSPRRALESLLVGTKRAFELLHEEGATWENRREIRNLRTQGQELFDLRAVPPNLRDDVATETSVYLREGLARVVLPPLDEVPDEREMAARVRDGISSVYSIPNTPFEIALTTTGPFAGRFQFTQGTVAHAANFFREVKGHPYGPGQAYVDGFYEAYFLTPGPLIPAAWIRGLPAWMLREFSDQAVWQWLLLVLGAGLFLVAVYVAHVLVGRASRDWSRLNRNLLSLLELVVVILMASALERFLDDHVHLTGGALQVVVFTSRLLTLGIGVGITIMLGTILTELILTARHLERRQIDQQLTRLAIRVLSVVTAVILVIEGMQRLGFSVATLLAGASVTGLAIALAAQDTLKNIFGGIMLSLDKPFAIGQRIQIKGHTGDVEQVGLRSTRIRTLAGHQVSIPNEEAARIEIENVGRRPHIRRDLNVTITYDTPPEKIRRALEILEEILSLPEEPEKAAGTADAKERPPHPNRGIHHRKFEPRVYFNELNADTLNLLAVYWFRPPDPWRALEHATWVNLQVMERFNAEGIEFAFPTQTVHLAGAGNPPTDPRRMDEGLGGGQLPTSQPREE